MKRFFLSFLGLGLILVSCSTPKSTVAPPDIFNAPWEDLSIFKSGLIESQQPVLDELTNASIYHLEFKIAEDMYHLTGTEEVRYTNTETVALNEVRLRLFPNVLGGKMTVSNVKVNGEFISPKLELQDSLLIVPFTKSLEPNQIVLLSMDFAVTVPQSVDAHYGVLVYFDDVLALAHAYPIICVYDDEGWKAVLPQQYGDVTYTDVSFYIVRIMAPKGITLVASGREISQDQDGLSQTLIVANGPARDFYLAASLKYQESTQQVDATTIHSYASSIDKEGAELALNTAARAVEDFSIDYSSYPYTELDIVETPTLAGGIEYPGLIAIASRFYDLDEDYSGVPGRIYMEATVAHEVSHQWFYNLVGDDQLGDPWLDEALAQFATLQYYTDEYGEVGAQGFRRALQGRWDRVNRRKLPIGLPVANYNDVEYGAIVYGRGPLFFVALKEAMGTEAFDAFLKDYTETLSWKISTPQTLQSIAEKHCACDLQKIFDEWVYL